MTTFDPGNLNVGTADLLGNPLAGEGITLPFVAPYCWWKNGDQSMRKLQSVEYFGGWSMDAADLMTAKLAAPSNFVADTWTGKNGDYNVFAGRSLGLAPIAKRSKWVVDDKGVGRSTTNVLAMAGAWDADAKQYLAFGPVVLTVKGTVTKYLMDAFKQFDAKTLQARTELANGLPASLFYAPIGTFGDARFELVGKEQKSTITPPVLGPLPEKIDGAVLQALYIGANSANEAAECKTLAKEWLADWERFNKKAPKADTAPGGEYTTQSDGVPF